MNFFTLTNPLIQHGRNVESQNGEDGIIEYIFGILPPENHRYCVELGAWDGRYLSNCFNLVRNHDWQGLFIEANKEKFQKLLINHKEYNNVKCLNKLVEFEGENKLDNFIAEADFPPQFDLLSIDIDGADYFVWESTERFRPKVVIVEFNPSIPNDVVFVQAKDMAVNQGASLLALILLGKQKSYELVCVTACNAIFVTSEFFPRFNIDSNHISQMYSPLCNGRIFHGYDSYIHVTGMPHLLWSNTTVASEDFQVLPISLRRYGDAQTE